MKLKAHLSEPPPRCPSLCTLYGCCWCCKRRDKYAVKTKFKQGITNTMSGAALRLQAGPRGSLQPQQMDQWGVAPTQNQAPFKLNLKLISYKISQMSVFVLQNRTVYPLTTWIFYAWWHWNCILWAPFITRHFIWPIQPSSKLHFYKAPSATDSKGYIQNLHPPFICKFRLLPYGLFSSEFVRNRLDRLAPNQSAVHLCVIYWTHFDIACSVFGPIGWLQEVQQGPLYSILSCISVKMQSILYMIIQQ